MSRIFYPTKAEWADAMAASLRREARLYPLVPSSDWRRVKRRTEAVRAFSADARRYERMAERYRAEGR